MVKLSQNLSKESDIDKMNNLGKTFIENSKTDVESIEEIREMADDYFRENFKD